MTVFYESLEWPWSLFEFALGENLIWLTVPNLYLLSLSQMSPIGVCLCVRMYVRWVHRLLVPYSLHYGCYLCYWCHLCYVCCLGYCHELSVGVSLTSVLNIICRILYHFALEVKV